MTRFIFITGGVVSSLGKGISAASLGALLQARGFKVRLRKLDPYLNVDPGTMSPYQHGEVFVTDDGAETDLDLGAVVGDEHLAMLGGRHRARIDVQIRVELAQPHLEATGLQHRAESRGGKTFTQRGDHASGDENVPSHGPSP